MGRSPDVMQTQISPRRVFGFPRTCHHGLSWTVSFLLLLPVLVITILLKSIRSYPLLVLSQRQRRSFWCSQVGTDPLWSLVQLHATMLVTNFEAFAPSCFGLNRKEKIVSSSLIHTGIRNQGYYVIFPMVNSTKPLSNNEGLPSCVHYSVRADLISAFVWVFMYFLWLSFFFLFFFLLLFSQVRVCCFSSIIMVTTRLDT